MVPAKQRSCTTAVARIRRRRNLKWLTGKSTQRTLKNLPDSVPTLSTWLQFRPQLQTLKMSPASAIIYRPARHETQSSILLPQEQPLQVLPRWSLASWKPSTASAAFIVNGRLRIPIVRLAAMSRAAIVSGMNSTERMRTSDPPSARHAFLRSGGRLRCGIYENVSGHSFFSFPEHTGTCLPEASQWICSCHVLWMAVRFCDCCCWL